MHTVLVQHLNNGHVKSCGCLNKEVAVKTMTQHGMCKTPEYRAWLGMRTRCRNPHGKMFENYGGRGITICERWESFENFYADMGDRPFKRASIDRIDNDGDYTPENCRWANDVEQLNNTRHNVKITIDGVTHNIFQWLKIYDIKPTTYYARIHMGWDRVDAIQKQVRKHL